jgi:uncharacterized protein YndB with AHSA1/START domain
MTPIKEIEFERTYDASIEVVWKAWTDPEILKQWWGPNDVSIPECRIDLRLGGEIYLVMKAGESMGSLKGTRWPMKGNFTSVDSNSNLAYTSQAWTEGDQEATQIDQINQINLTETNGKTTVKVKVTINKTGPKAEMAVEGLQWGYNQQLDKLNDFLAK